MGRRGPPRKPTTLGILEGSRRSIDRAGAEPKPQSGRPRQPPRLTPAEKTVWKQAIKILDDMGILTVADGGAITRYCQMYAEWWRHKLFCEKNGICYVITDKNGNDYYQTYPQSTKMNQLNTALARMEKEFGLTPAARAGISIDPAINKPVVRARSRA